MSDRIAMLTVGQSPRTDLVPHMAEVFSRPVEIIERGALDDLSREQIERLRPEPGKPGVVSRLRDGSEVLMDHRHLLPLVQRRVDEVAGLGVGLIVVLCGADWSALRSPVLVVNPGRIFPAVIGALAKDRHLGVIKPNAGQVEGTRRMYAEQGIRVTVTSASPYLGEARLNAAREAAQHLRGAGVDLVWMTCVGMDEAMRQVVAETTGKPVILARTLLARIVDELMSGVAIPVA